MRSYVVGKDSVAEVVFMKPSRFFTGLIAVTLLLPVGGHPCCWQCAPGPSENISFIAEPLIAQPGFMIPSICEHAVSADPCNPTESISATLSGTGWSHRPQLAYKSYLYEIGEPGHSVKGDPSSSDCQSSPASDSLRTVILLI
jgi:hypothetical protein